MLSGERVFEDETERISKIKIERKKKLKNQFSLLEEKEAEVKGTEVEELGNSIGV